MINWDLHKLSYKTYLYNSHVHRTRCSFLTWFFKSLMMLHILNQTVGDIFLSIQRWQTRSGPRSRHRQNPAKGFRLLWHRAADAVRVCDDDDDNLLTMLLLLWSCSDILKSADLCELLIGIHWDGHLDSSCLSCDDKGMFVDEVGLDDVVDVVATCSLWLSLTTCKYLDQY